jgi:hypothetical protein
MMIFLHAMVPLISSHGLLIICTAETHRKKSHRQNVLLTFYKLPYNVSYSSKVYHYRPVSFQKPNL